MAKLNANYETVMIFSLSNGEEKVAELVEKFKALIGENATVTNVEEWGKRRLAYPINDEAEGHYLFVEYNCAPAFPAELDRILKITEGVLRSMIIVKNED